MNALGLVQNSAQVSLRALSLVRDKARMVVDDLARRPGIRRERPYFLHALGPNTRQGSDRPWTHETDQTESKVFMADFCQYLKPERFGYGLRCAAGVNFASVGQDRAVCRVCPLAQLGNVPLCPNLEVYTYLQGGFSNTTRVDVECACLTDATTRAAAQCVQCPEREQQG